MLPLPQFLYWKINTALQFVSSEIGVALVRAHGVPVFLDGNVIDLGIYKLLVAEACSGLRYLFPIMSFSYVFAVLYRGPVWHKIVLLLAAVPIAVLMNALRIGVIGVLVDRYGIGQAEGFLHFFEGWVIFLSCIAHPVPHGARPCSGCRATAGRSATRSTSTSPASAPSPPACWRSPPSPALVAAALMTAALSAAWALAPAREVEPRRRATPSPLPARARRLVGRAAALAPRSRRCSAPTTISPPSSAPGRGRGGRPVRLLLRQPDRRRAPSTRPRSACPPAAGRSSPIEPVEVDAARHALGTFTLNRAVIQKGLENQLVYYWFEGRGRRLTNDFAAKFHTVADGLRRGRTDGGLVRVITPIGAGRRGGGRRTAPALPRGHVDRLPRFIPDERRTSRPAPMSGRHRPAVPARLDPVISYNTRAMTLACLRSLAPRPRCPTR